MAGARGFDYTLAPAGTVHAEGVSTISLPGGTPRAQGILFFDYTAESGTSPTFDVDLQAQDPVSGTWMTLSSITQMSAVSTQTLSFNAEYFAAENLRLQITIGGSATPTCTVSIGLSIGAK
jgi:hypothetical protein